MTRPLPLVLIAFGLCAGCATTHHSEANVLASDIMRERSSSLVCPVGDIRVCAVDVDDSMACHCSEHGAVFGGR